MANLPDTAMGGTRSRRGRLLNLVFTVGIVALALLLATIGAAAGTDAETPLGAEQTQPESDTAPDAGDTAPEDEADSASRAEELLEDFAAALSERVGEDVAVEDIEGALTDVIEARLDAAVEDGDLTRDQADAILEGLQGEGFRFPVPRFQVPAPDDFRGPRDGERPFPFFDDAPPQPAPQVEVGDPYVGIQGATVDPEIVDLFGLDIGSGAIVAAVGEDTPAAAAGLERGDVITAVDGQQIDSFEDLAVAIAEREVGDTVTLTVVRDGEESDVEVELGARPGADDS